MEPNEVCETIDGADVRVMWPTVPPTIQTSIELTCGFCGNKLKLCARRTPTNFAEMIRFFLHKHSEAGGCH